MAQKYRKIDPRIWDDEKFEGLSVIAKLVCFQVLTAQSNRCGIFKYSPALAIEQIGIEPDSYATALEQVISALRWRWDSARKVLYLPTWWKYNPPENSSHLKGCLDDIHDLPQTFLVKEFTSNTKHIPLHCLDTFTTAMGTGVAHQEQEQEQEQDIIPASAGGEEKTVKSSTKEKRKNDPTEHSKARDFFIQQWKKRYGEKDPWDYGKEDGLLKKFLARMKHDMGEVKRVMLAYLSDPEKWITDNGHSFSNLNSKVTRYMAEQSAMSILLGGEVQMNHTPLTIEEQKIAFAGMEGCPK